MICCRCPPNLADRPTVESFESSNIIQFDQIIRIDNLSFFLLSLELLCCISGVSCCRRFHVASLWHGTLQHYDARCCPSSGPSFGSCALRRQRCCCCAGRQELRQEDEGRHLARRSIRQLVSLKAFSQLYAGPVCAFSPVSRSSAPLEAFALHTTHVVARSGVTRVGPLHPPAGDHSTCAEPLFCGCS